MEPKIVTIDLKMAGVQGVIDHDAAFGPALSELWQKLAARLESIADKTNPLKAIGYWQFVDNSTRVYFAGVQVKSLENLKWDHKYGLALWNPGPTLFAIFQEKNGEEGSTAGYAFQKIEEMGYTYDDRFLGDFEACPLEWIMSEKRPEDGYHEIWIPIAKKNDDTRN